MRARSGQTLRHAPVRAAVCIADPAISAHEGSCADCLFSQHKCAVCMRAGLWFAWHSMTDLSLWTQGPVLAQQVAPQEGQEQSQPACQPAAAGSQHTFPGGQHREHDPLPGAARQSGQQLCKCCLAGKAVFLTLLSSRLCISMSVGVRSLLHVPLSLGGPLCCAMCYANSPLDAPRDKRHSAGAALCTSYAQGSSAAQAQP